MTMRSMTSLVRLASKQLQTKMVATRASHRSLATAFSSSASGQAGATPNTSSAFAIAGATLLVAAGSSSCLQDSSATLCDAKEEPKEATKEEPTPKWCGTVPEEDIDELVTQILNDPTINISSIPDSIERRIYKSTIQLTIGAFYSAIGSINGTTLLAHEIRLHKQNRDDDDDDDAHQAQRKLFLSSASEKSMIDDKILEDVAERLISNKAINFSMVPDALERQIYTNCIKIIFRILTAVSQTFALQVCGHQLRFVIDAADDGAMQQSAVQAASSLSKVDMQQLVAFAKDSGIDEELGWWDALFVRKQFVAQMHASLYGLVLGILDDMLANTKIHILNDELTLDIVAAAPKKLRTAQQAASRSVEAKDASVGSFAAASFAAGVGVGVSAMAILASSSK